MFKVGDKVVVTVDSPNPCNFNVVGAVGTVLNTRSVHFPEVNFDRYGVHMINEDRIALYETYLRCNEFP